MGGFGSGRHSGRRCAEDMLALDVRTIHRKGLLKPGTSRTWQWSCNGASIATIGLAVEWDRVVLDYRNRSHCANGGEWEPMHYAVRLDWTRCGLGGHRVCWLCPALGCGRRVAVLYGGRVFSCRQCNGLAYRSQRETDDDRATRRANTMRRRLGWEPGILNDDGGKPKGMHWRTYWRLRAEHNSAMNRALAGIAWRLEMLNSRIGRMR
jgi:hypothetical protein